MAATTMNRGRDAAIVGPHEMTRTREAQAALGREQDRLAKIEAEVGRLSNGDDALTMAEHKLRAMTAEPERLKACRDIEKAKAAYEAALDSDRAAVREQFKIRKRDVIAQLVPILRAAQVQMIALVELEDNECGLIGGMFQTSVDRFAWPSLQRLPDGTSFLGDWLARLGTVGLYDGETT